MKRFSVIMLVLAVSLGVTAASAQTVFCPSGGFTMTVPDEFADVPPSGLDDPDLVLHLTDGDVNLAVYVSFSGSDSGFQVLTGDEIEYGPVNINGMDMFYARGLDAQGNWITYSWMRASNAVTVYFVWFGNDDATLELIAGIMSSVVFER